MQLAPWLPLLFSISHQSNRPIVSTSQTRQTARSQHSTRAAQLARSTVTRPSEAKQPLPHFLRAPGLVNMATDPLRHDGRADSSRTQDTPSAPSGSSTKRPRSQSLAEPSDEEGNPRQPAPSHSTRQSSRSSPISVPSDDEDEYAPSQADGIDDDDDEDSEVAPRRKHNASKSLDVPQANTSRAATSDFPFVPAMHGTSAEWSALEEEILLNCVRKHGRRWSEVASAYSKAAKGPPVRTAKSLSQRYNRLANLAMEKEGGVQQTAKSQRGNLQRQKVGQVGGRGKGGNGGRMTGSQRASTSSAASQGTFSFNRSSTGRRSQQLASRHRDGSHEAEDESDEEQGSDSAELEVKQEINEDTSQLPTTPSTVARSRPRSAINARTSLEGFDCDATYEDYGLTFQGIPGGYSVYILSPRRFKIRGPSANRRRQSEDLEEAEDAAFVFNIQDGSVQATASPPSTAMQVSLAPPSMTFTAPDKFTVIFLL